jgi:hypothetical protein
VTAIGVRQRSKYYYDPEKECGWMEVLIKGNVSKIFLLFILCVGCAEGSKYENNGNNRGRDSIESGSDSGSNKNSGDDTSMDSINGYVCHVETVGSTRVPARVTLLEDKSQSMMENNKWNLALDAIESMVSQFDSDIAFGLDLFSVSTMDEQSCDVGESVVLDTVLGNGSDVMRRLTSTEPNGATPLLLAMLNYADPEYAPLFVHNDAQSYLVIVSDGEDTCGEKGVFNLDEGASAEMLGDAAALLLESLGIQTIAIGFGDGINPEQLNAIASRGGTSFTTFLNASDGEELTAALVSIAETVVVSCRYSLGEVEKNADLDLVNVYFDGTAVPRDTGCAHGIGWTWVDDSRRMIQFCEHQCSLLEASRVSEIVIKIMCDESELVLVK